MKLKTLKDMDKYFFDEEYDGKEGNLLVYEKELKEEAIKWVKYYRENSFAAKKQQWLQDRFLAAGQALMNFHDITEEDLK